MCIALVLVNGNRNEWTIADVAYYGAGAVTGIVVAPLALSAAGFTAGGVAAGSIAAGLQSVAYGGATTGAFSLAQSAGAAGIGQAATVVAGGIGATAAEAVRKLTEE